MQFVPQYANTHELRKEALRIRHRVFCEELGWEAPHPSQLETDGYDFYAQHLITRAAENNAVVGSVRMIPAVVRGQTKPLPIEHAYDCPIDSFAAMRGINRDCVVEISRLVTAPQLRRTRSTALQQQNECESAPTLSGPKQIGAAISLYLASISLGRRSLFECAVMLIEPKLSRQLNWMGFVNKAIGPSIEHRGERVPCLFDLKATLSSFSPVVQALHAQIDAQLFSAEPQNALAGSENGVRELRHPTRVSQ